MAKQRKIQLNNPVSATEEEHVSSVYKAESVGLTATENLFGEWTWYTDDIDQEIRDAWKRWTENFECMVR